MPASPLKMVPFLLLLAEHSELVTALLQCALLHVEQDSSAANDANVLP
jgi:hypothetical protein